MIVDGQLNKGQLKELRQALRQLDFPPKKRQRLLWRLAKYGVINAAARHVRQQQTPDGTAWAKRKGRRRGKMLRNLPKLLHIREMPETESVRIYLQGGGYRNGANPVPAGVVGYGQQRGMSVSVKGRQAQKGKSDPARLATRRQAKKLRSLGYRVKQGARWRKPAYSEIEGVMRFDQAGLLIKKLSGKAAKAAWTIDVPARPFLGMSDEEFNKALARQLQAIGFGWNVNAQDIKG